VKERKTPERKVAEVVEIEEVEKMEEGMPVGDSKVRTAPEVVFFFIITTCTGTSEATGKSMEHSDMVLTVSVAMGSRS